MTVEQKLWKLIKRLHEKTKDASLTWEPLPSKNTFLAVFPSYAVSIAEVPGEEDAPDYAITLLNEAGKPLERVTDVQLRETVSEEGQPETSAFRIMEELYNMARRSALGVDQALDKLLSSLDEDG